MCLRGGSTIPASHSGVLPATNQPATARLSFAQAFDPKNNAFGFLRLALAVLVIFSHSYPLGGFGIDRLESYTGGRYTIGLVSVAMFFVLSGFLICRSASNSRTVFRFLWHRFLRIFPAYWVCLVMCACVFAPLVAYIEFDTFLRVFSAPRNSPQDFMIGNAALFHFNHLSISGILLPTPTSIAGLLSQNPMPRVINGSLWTLPFEVTCYLGVALLAATGVLRRAKGTIIALYAGLWGLYAFDCLDPKGFWQCFPYVGMKSFVMLSLFFTAGCAAFLYREKIPYSRAAFAISLLLVAASLPLGIFGLIAPIAMTYAFLWLAFALPFARFDRKGDFSYGTYIYAFPVQQGLALIRIQDEGFALYFTCSLLLTSVLAVLSYRLIEAPSLRLKALKIPRFPETTGSSVVQPTETPGAHLAARTVL